MTNLRQLQKAESPDNFASENKINELADFQAQTKIIGLNHWFAVNKVLTADHQKVLAHRLGRREMLKYRTMQRFWSTLLGRRTPFAQRGPVR